MGTVNVRTDNSVTLEHATAGEVARMLSDYARGNYSHAKRTKSAVVRDICIRTAQAADAHAEAIYRGMSTWTVKEVA